MDRLLNANKNNDDISEVSLRPQYLNEYIGQNDLKDIVDEFDKVPYLYIADGHHRAASAVKVGLKRRAEHPDYDGTEDDDDDDWGGDSGSSGDDYGGLDQNTYEEFFGHF